MGGGRRGPVGPARDPRGLVVMGSLATMGMAGGLAIDGPLHARPGETLWAAVSLGMLAAALGVYAVRVRPAARAAGRGGACRAPADIGPWIPGLGATLLLGALGWALLLAGARTQGGLLIVASSMAWAGIWGLLAPDEGRRHGDS